jgi:GalNAc-alpha-(1->4)-GalNAc-alpha-(1->3)-diNAcBac-PP-undecaprenol alpha-1,4-N-acetyl-D-galactosaminyltransferase
MSVRRVVMVIPNLTGGGAARVAAILVNEWAAMGVETHLVSFEDPGLSGLYQVSGAVRRHEIGHFASPRTPWGMIATNLGRARDLRKVLRAVRPEGVIAFLQEANVAAIIATRGLRIPVVISERNHPGHLPLPAVKRLIRAWAYPLATRICVQTADIASWFNAKLRLECTVIANPAPALDPAMQGSSLATGRAGEANFLLSLGRLEPQKGFDLLIEAFAKLVPDFPTWTLVIHGEGAERSKLEALAARLGVADRVALPGVTDQPSAKLLSADIYVHPARFEGYPNSLLEALAAGRCVVATDCPGATREVLADGRFGLLVNSEDVDALSLGLRQTMGNPNTRARFSALAPGALKQLSPTAIARRWLDVLVAERQ